MTPVAPGRVTRGEAEGPGLATVTVQAFNILLASAVLSVDASEVKAASRVT